MSWDNRQSPARIRALAERHGFDMYLASAPIYEGLAAAPAFRRYHALLRESLAGLAGEGSRVHLVFDQPMTFPASEMQNVDHLVRNAANRFTLALALRIREIERGVRVSARPGR
jgi:hypothetical protein